MGGEDCFVWREMMEKRQQENDRQMRTVLRQTKQLKEELWAQMSTIGPFQSQHTQRWHTNLRRTVEMSYLRGIEFSSSNYSK